ncbi:MAG TPA: twin-arginine translocase TatA/TatE family subunit, partial [Acidobacteriaceae bacterium]|nr:twin-arginine translocase TatA/TatE family subunit [Acidobacteriaceae bacterium]
DSIFIFILALVLVGPKKLPEVARQVGKLLAEFRRASNEFKFQIQEEIRNMEEDERRKKLEESRAATAAAAKSEEIPPPPEIVAQTPTSLEESTPTIQPPSEGETVSTGRPFATPAEEPLPVSPELALNSADLVEEATTPDAVHSNGNHPLAGDVSEHESVHHD